MASRRASATVAIRDAARSCTSRRYWSQRETTIGANLMPPDLSGLPRLVRASGNAARHHNFVGEGGLEPPRPCGHRNLNPARPTCATCVDPITGGMTCVFDPPLATPRDQGRPDRKSVV